MKIRWALLAIVSLPALAHGQAQDLPFTRAADVIYGRKFGTALTLDVFTPRKDPNGAAVVAIVSGGWFSSHEAIDSPFIMPVVLEHIRRGYTVFTVVHGSQPKFTIPEAVADMNRAVRFIRHRAKEFGIDPERIGITGGSAGGHLSLMQGTAGTTGDPKAKDLVDRASSRVQAVACYYPPTDFLNYGEKGKDAVGRGILANFKAAFDIRELDPKTKALERTLADDEKLLDLGRRISPITHVSADDPPTLIIHGDADKLVPLQQAESFLAKLKEAGVATELVVKKGAAHGWPDLAKDHALIADWFDKHLVKK